MPDLAQWDSFYVIVGSAAGALIGLQFVVMTLLADSPSLAAPEAGAAFGSPTIVHFSVVLLLAAIVRVPWPNIAMLAFVLGALGVLGVIYILVVSQRMRAQNAYSPDLEDWIFHSLVPFVAYALLAVSAIIGLGVRWAMFGVGASALLLLFDGIHNSWDSVAYHVFVMRRRDRAPPQ